MQNLTRRKASCLRSSRTACLGLLLLAPTLTSLRAEVLVNEPFAYPDGPLVEVSSGLWSTHSGTAGQVNVRAGAVDLTDQASEDVNLALLSGPLPASSDAVLYAAFTVNFTALPRGTGTFFAHFKDGTTGFRGRLFAATTGAAEGRLRVGIAEAATTPVWLETDLDLQTAYTLVCRYEVATAHSTLWVNPTHESDPGVVAGDDGTAIAVHSFAFRQSLSGGNSMGTLTVDDLRVATSFAELFAPPGDAPAITRQPQSLTVVIGTEVTFSVAATGRAPLHYQWLRNQEPLPGATDATFLLTAARLEDAGAYQVVVGNDVGSVTSAVAQLAVTDTPPVGEPPVVSFTHVLEHLVRPGDQATNTFTEHSLRPGEQLTLTVTATDPAGLAVSVEPVTNPLPASAHWDFGATTGPSVTGTFTMVPTAADAGQLVDVELRTSNQAGTQTVSWRIYVPTPAEQQVVLAEYFANPTASTEALHFNPLRRDEPATNPGVHDEYLELVNLGTADLSLEGWTLSDAVQVRHRFPAPTLLPAANALVVFGGPREVSPPRLDVEAQPASEGSAGLALNNTGDQILLRNALGYLIERVVFTASQMSSLGSMSRHPTLADGFVPQATAGPDPVTPGRRPDGQRWSESVPPVLETVGLVDHRLNPDGTLTFTWPVVAGHTYSVLSASTLDGPWQPVATGLTQGEWTEPAASTGPACFYRVRSP
jgi:hypothetical protein